MKKLLEILNKLTDRMLLIDLTIQKREDKYFYYQQRQEVKVLI